MDTPIRSCMQRDVKGLYAKAMRCEITNFTGVTSPYEPSETAADPGRDEPAHGGPLIPSALWADGVRRLGHAVHSVRQPQHSRGDNRGEDGGWAAAEAGVASRECRSHLHNHYHIPLVLGPAQPRLRTGGAAPFEKHIFRNTLLGNRGVRRRVRAQAHLPRARRNLKRQRDVKCYLLKNAIIYCVNMKSRALMPHATAQRRCRCRF
jgi:hypothetical protein